MKKVLPLALATWMMVVPGNLTPTFANDEDQTEHSENQNLEFLVRHLIDQVEVEEIRPNCPMYNIPTELAFVNGRRDSYARVRVLGADGQPLYTELFTGLQPGIVTITPIIELIARELQSESQLSIGLEVNGRDYGAKQLDVGTYKASINYQSEGDPGNFQVDGLNPTGYSGKVNHVQMIEGGGGIVFGGHLNMEALPRPILLLLRESLLLRDLAREFAEDTQEDKPPDPEPHIPKYVNDTTLRLSPESYGVDPEPASATYTFTVTKPLRQASLYLTAISTGILEDEENPLSLDVYVNNNDLRWKPIVQSTIPLTSVVPSEALISEVDAYHSVQLGKGINVGILTPGEYTLTLKQPSIEDHRQVVIVDAAVYGMTLQ